MDTYAQHFRSRSSRAYTLGTQHNLYNLGIKQPEPPSDPPIQDHTTVSTPPVEESSDNASTQNDQTSSNETSSNETESNEASSKDPESKIDQERDTRDHESP